MFFHHCYLVLRSKVGVKVKVKVTCQCKKSRSTFRRAGVDIRGSALPSAAKSNRGLYQSKVFVCMFVISGHVRVIARMRLIGFYILPLHWLFLFFPPTKEKKICRDPSPIEYTVHGLSCVSALHTCTEIKLVLFKTFRLKYCSTVKGQSAYLNQFFFSESHKAGPRFGILNRHFRSHRHSEQPYRASPLAASKTITME